MPYSSKEIIKRLKKDGWYKAGQQGSHTQWKHDEKLGKITVPHPKRTLHPKTVKSIFKLAGWGKP